MKDKGKEMDLRKIVKRLLRKESLPSIGSSLFSAPMTLVSCCKHLFIGIHFSKLSLTRGTLKGTLHNELHIYTKKMKDNFSAYDSFRMIDC